MVASFGVVAIVVALLTGLGLRLSRRSLLPSKAAFLLVVAVAIIEFLATQPVVTHAVLANLPAPSSRPRDRMMWIYFFGIATVVAPAFMAFAVARIAGVPPNKSLERTREG